MVPQADRQEQQPLVPRKRGEDRRPQRVVHEYDRIVAVAGIGDLKAVQKDAGLPAELIKRQRRDQFRFGDDLPGRSPDA